MKGQEQTAVNLYIVVGDVMTGEGKQRDIETISIFLRYAAETACEKSPVVYIYGDNRFNPYAIARLARQLHLHRLASSAITALFAKKPMLN
jgi:hypothetical protein